MYRFPLQTFQDTPTPFYYYDLKLLNKTLDEINRQIKGHPFKVHYAVKANGNKTILEEIAKKGFGVDLVSGGEISAALVAGLPLMAWYIQAWEKPTQKSTLAWTTTSTVSMWSRCLNWK